jgi:hypothetical protein
MDSEQKSSEIIKEIVRLANTGIPVTIEKDWGDANTCTIFIGDDHTHMGWPDCTHDQLIDNLYDLLINGQGLSFDIPIEGIN